MKNWKIESRINEMLGVDVREYSLVLIKDGAIIYSSQRPGLRPLVECVEQCRAKFKECTLYDRIIGLAAARVVVYSDMISLVLTRVSSKAAKELLGMSNIEMKAQRTVENILTHDKSSICPMEKKAQGIEDNKSFFCQLRDIFDV